MDEQEDLSIVPAAAGPSLFNIASRVLNRPLLLHPTKAEIILHVLQGRLPIGGESLAPLSPDASRFIGTHRREDGTYKMNRATKGVAMLTIDGSLVNRGAWIGANSGLVSYEGISAQLREAAADPEIHTVLLDIDSPGGEATGMFATAELIREVNKQTPVIAFVNDMAASAAYGLASAASEIIVSPTSIVGSIGVVLTHLDRSGELEQKGVAVTLIHAGAHKVDGHPFGPLSDTVKADLQAEVTQFYDQFVGLVAKGRGGRLTEEAARATEARTFLGKEAVERGLADRIVSLDAVLAELTQQTRRVSYQRSDLSMDKSTKADPQAENTGITEATHQAAVTAARAEGAATERARITGIMRGGNAAGREAQATTLALETSLTAEEADKVLASLPKGAVTGSIEDRASKEAEFGDGGASTEASPGAAFDAAWDKALAKYK